MEAKESKLAVETNKIVAQLKGEVDQLREVVSEEKQCIEELKAQSEFDKSNAKDLQIQLSEIQPKLKDALSKANIYQEQLLA